MILGHNEIHNRLAKGEIFRKDTWDPNCVKEASYALRVANDGLMLGGKPYLPEKDFLDGDIKIAPGEIAILSTIERLVMPGDLVGKIGIRFDYASQGLTGLMGIQVDPFYGWGHTDERLYIRVANLGNETIAISLGADVFTFELHMVHGHVPEPEKPRLGMWHRLQDILANQAHASWSNVTKVQVDVSSLNTRLESATKEVRNYLQPLVMFGIFLIAVTILGVALSVVVTGSDLPEREVPMWVRNWGWKVLLGTLSFGAAVTGVVGLITVADIFWRTIRRT